MLAKGLGWGEGEGIIRLITAYNGTSHLPTFIIPHYFCFTAGFMSFLKVIISSKSLHLFSSSWKSGHACYLLLIHSISACLKHNIAMSELAKQIK